MYASAVINLMTLVSLVALMMVATDAAPLSEAVKRYVRSAGSLSQQQQYNMQTAAGNADFMVVQRENGDLDVVTSGYQTSLTTYRMSITELPMDEVSNSRVFAYSSKPVTSALQVNLEGFELPAGKRLVFNAACGAALQVKLVDTTAKLTGESHLVTEAVADLVQPNVLLYKTWKRVTPGVAVSSCYMEVRRDQTVHMKAGQSNPPVSSFGVYNVPALNRAHHFTLVTAYGNYSTYDENATNDNDITDYELLGDQLINQTDKLTADWLSSSLPTILINVFSWILANYDE